MHTVFVFVFFSFFRLYSYGWEQKEHWITLGGIIFRTFCCFLGCTLHTVSLLLFWELTSLLAVFYTHTHPHTHTHVKPATTRSSREVYDIFVVGLIATGFSDAHVASCTLTTCFFCIACSHDLVAEKLFFLFFSLSLYNCVRMGLCACFCCCLFMFVCLFVFVHFFVNACVVSVLGFGVKVSLHMSPYSASLSFYFSRDHAVPIP